MIVAGLILYVLVVAVFVLSFAAVAKHPTPAMELDPAKLVPLPITEHNQDSSKASLDRAA